MCVHVLFGLFTMVVACLWWNYQAAHFCFIITMVTCSIYNASLHYAEQFRLDRERDVAK
jgi:hypothetical protein